MEEYLIISNANFLLRVASEQIAYVCSEGSYCNLRLTNGDEYTFSFNLVVFEKKIVEQLVQTAHFFARVGRNYIINSQHIFSINLNTSELVLYNERFSEKFTLHVSKEPLKQLNNAAQMLIASKNKQKAKLYLQLFIANANRLEDKKEAAQLISQAKEQLKQ